MIWPILGFRLSRFSLLAKICFFRVFSMTLNFRSAALAYTAFVRMWTSVICTYNLLYVRQLTTAERKLIEITIRFLRIGSHYVVLRATSIAEPSFRILKKGFALSLGAASRNSVINNIGKIVTRHDFL